MRIAYMRLILIGMFLLPLGSELPAQARDSSYARIVGRIILDSFRMHQKDETYVAADSSTAILLRATGTLRMDPSPPRGFHNCSGAALYSGPMGVPSRVGYTVAITDTLSADSSRAFMGVRLSCSYERARTIGGSETVTIIHFGVWELRRMPGGWVIVRVVRRG